MIILAEEELRVEKEAQRQLAGEMDRQTRVYPNSSEGLIAERAIAATQIEELDKAMEEEDVQAMDTLREV